MTTTGEGGTAETTPAGHSGTITGAQAADWLIRSALPAFCELAVLDDDCSQGGGAGGGEEQRFEGPAVVVLAPAGQDRRAQ